MKKLILLAIAFTFSVGAIAAPSFKGVSDCKFESDDYNYCSKSNIAKYKAALKTQKPNFDGHYILINLLNRKDGYNFIALDTKTGYGYTMEEVFSEPTKMGKPTGKPVVINYSINNSYLCIKGDIYAYRNAYDNVKACYSIQENEYSKLGKGFALAGDREELN